MDPSFWFAYVTSAQQLQMARSAAQRAMQEQNEAAQKAAILENRRKLLSEIDQESKQHEKEASRSPQKTYIQTIIQMNGLHQNGVVPDSFEELKEREDAALLWRKLANLADKCKSNMTPEQLAQCNKCMDAIWRQMFIQAVSARSNPYLQFQQVKPLLDKARLATRKINRYQVILWMSLVFIGILGIVVYALSVDADRANNGLIVWVVALGAIGLAGHLAFEGKRPKDILKLEYQAQQLSSEAGLQDEEFWKLVVEKYGELPTIEQLQADWGAQSAIIGEIFPPENREEKE